MGVHGNCGVPGTGAPYSTYWACMYLWSCTLAASRLPRAQLIRVHVRNKAGGAPCNFSLQQQTKADSCPRTACAGKSWCSPWSLNLHLFSSAAIFSSVPQLPFLRAFKGSLAIRNPPEHRGWSRQPFPRFFSCQRPNSAPSSFGRKLAHRIISSLRLFASSLPGVAAIKMDGDDRSIGASLAAQDPIVRELLRHEVEHGVLIPLKTTLELRDDYQTGRVLITRAPTKSANPAIV